MNPENAFDIFQRGVAAADAKLGQEARDYDRVLHGLGQLLDTAGLASGRADGWHWELHDRFHDPLCVVGAIQSPAELVRVIQSLDAGLERRSHETNYLEGQIAGGHLPPPFSPYYAATETRANLERQLREIAKQFAEGGELRHQLDGAGKLARHYDRCADIAAALCEAVGGEAGTGLAALRTRAQALIASAAQLEARARGVQERLRTRQAAIPVEAAQSIRPLADLKPAVKQKYRNQADPGRFASDGFWIADLEALDDKAKATLALPGDETRPLQARMAGIWDGCLKSPRPVALLGVLPNGQAVLATEDHLTVTVDAARLRWLWQQLWPDSLALSNGATRLTLQCAGQALAALGIEGKLSPNEFCTPLAREKAAGFPALTRPAPKRRNGKA